MPVLSAGDDALFLVEVPADGPDSRGLLRLEAASISLFSSQNYIFQDLGLGETNKWS